MDVASPLRSSRRLIGSPLRPIRPAKFFAPWALESRRAVVVGAIFAVATTGSMRIGTDSRLSVGTAVGGR